MPRTYIIGDIHGALLALKEILKKGQQKDLQEAQWVSHLFVFCTSSCKFAHKCKKSLTVKVWKKYC